MDGNQSTARKGASLFLSVPDFPAARAGTTLLKGPVMAAEYNHNANRVAVIAALKWELASAVTREHKAAVQAELERLAGATGDEDRSSIETAGPAPRAAAPHTEELAAEEARRARHAEVAPGFDGR